MASSVAPVRPTLSSTLATALLVVAAVLLLVQQQQQQVEAIRGALFRSGRASGGPILVSATAPFDPYGLLRRFNGPPRQESGESPLVVQQRSPYMLDGGNPFEAAAELEGMLPPIRLFHDRQHDLLGQQQQQSVVMAAQKRDSAEERFASLKRMPEVVPAIMPALPSNGGGGGGSGDQAPQPPQQHHREGGHQLLAVDKIPAAGQQQQQQRDVRDGQQQFWAQMEPLLWARLLREEQQQ